MKDMVSGPGLLRSHSYGLRLCIPPALCHSESSVIKVVAHKPRVPGSWPQAIKNRLKQGYQPD